MTPLVKDGFVGEGGSREQLRQLSDHWPEKPPGGVAEIQACVESVSEGLKDCQLGCYPVCVCVWGGAGGNRQRWWLEGGGNSKHHYPLLSPSSSTCRSERGPFRKEQVPAARLSSWPRERESAHYTERYRRPHRGPGCWRSLVNLPSLPLWRRSERLPVIASFLPIPPPTHNPFASDPAYLLLSLSGS